MNAAQQITPEQLSQLVSYTINWEITPELIQHWMAASRCEFIGGDPVSPVEAHEQLIKLRDTKKFAGRERLGFLNIFYKGRHIGFSLPRVLDTAEYVKYGVSREKEYYRMGTIFVREDYRSRGIATETTRQFMEQHPYIVWEHKIKNVSSQHVALALGMTKRHTLYYDKNHSWYLAPFDHVHRVALGWATGITPQ